MRTILLTSLLALSSLLSAQAQIAAKAPVAVTVDLQQVGQPVSSAFGWFGYDEANYTTAPGGRALLRELHDLAATLVTVRMHHLLTSGDGTPALKWSSTGVYREDAQGRPVYDFHILDGIFDELQQAGVRPMVELGFMPEDLAAVKPGKAQPYRIPFPTGDVLAGASQNPPRAYARWRDLVQAVTAHLVQRYGASTVRQWRFEVWNEPDIAYWHGTPEQYWRLYDFAVAGVRAALPGALVGGPASTSPRNAHAAAFLEGFLQHVETGRSAATGGPVPLDFVTFHAKGQPVAHGMEVTMGLGAEMQDADRGFAILAAHPRLRGLPVILSEADPEGCAACSSKSNPANNYRNGTAYPAYTAAAYSGLLQLAARHRVRLEGMLSWSFEFEGRESFEGFRDLATNGVDKPILNLFRMLGQMQGRYAALRSEGAVPLEDVLAGNPASQPDLDGMAAVDAAGASVLLWNYQPETGSRGETGVQLRVQHLPAGVHRVLLTESRIDREHSDAYTAWQAMGSPAHPNAAQTAALQQQAGLAVAGSPAWADVDANGAVRVTNQMPAESLVLYTLQWPAASGAAVRSRTAAAKAAR